MTGHAGIGWRAMLLGAGVLVAFSGTRVSTLSATPKLPSAVHVVRVDSFPHARHTALACLTCHRVGGDGSALVFEVPRGCDLCHHQAAMRGQIEMRECSACHKAILTPPAPPADGVLPRRKLDHSQHRATTCATCHVAPNLAPSKEVASCTSCHESHHTSQRDCASCHRSPDLLGAHERASHQKCDDCHAAETVAMLTPDRGFCVTCHEPQRAHVPKQECTTCHFLTSPAEYQKRLSAEPTR